MQVSLQLYLILAECSLLLEYQFSSSVGQLIFDATSNHYDAAQGSSLLVESTDPISTDRGVYFAGGTLLSLFPNCLNSFTLLPLSVPYLFVIDFYAISAGCLVSITNGSTTKMSICWAAGSLTITQGGVSVSQSVAQGTWKSVIIGYYIVNLTVLVCVSNGILVNALAPCSSATASALTLSTTDLVLLGTNPVTSQQFSGFIYDFYLYSDYTTALVTYGLFLPPLGSASPYTTLLLASCNCGSYSCSSLNANTCIECDPTCSSICYTTTSGDCVNPVTYCSPYYYDASTGSCDLSITAIIDCLTQSSSTVCVTCDAGYALSPSSNACCILGTYYSAGSCLACYSDCATCSGGTSAYCLTCTDSHAAVASPPGTCSCNTGYYPSATGPLVCAACNSDCSSCSAGLNTNCMACSDTHASVASPPGQCLCNAGYYASASSPLVCTACNSDCSTCSGGLSSNCLACSDSHASVASPPGQCACNGGYYASATSPLVCTLCNSDCTTCSGGLSSSCTACSDTHASVASPPGQCACNADYYASSTNPLVCAVCNSECTSCSGGVNTDCLACSDAHASVASPPGQCLCNTDYYASATNPLVCSPCNTECTSCTGGLNTDCLACSDGNASVGSPPGQCLCNTDYYASASNPLACTLCNSECSSCSGGLNTDCLACSDSHASVASPPGQCACNTDCYASSTNPLVCAVCNSECTSCSGGLNTNCVACSDIHASVASPPGQCLCDAGYYASATNPIVCTICNSECGSCTGALNTNCLTCSDTNSVVTSPPGQCFCTADYYSSSTNPLVCTICNMDCTNCSGALNTDCLSCTDPFASISSPPGQCLCNSGYYASSANPLVCSICNIDCTTCSAGTNSACLTCLDLHAAPSPVPGACFCSSGYFAVSTGPLVCASCDPTCSTCVGPSSVQCLSCSDLYASLSASPGTCACGYGSYLASSTPLLCMPCDLSCATCTGGSIYECLTCAQPNSSILDSVCQCNNGFYLEVNTCLPCYPTCSRCAGEGAYSCMECLEEIMIIESGACVCPEFTWTDGNQCTNCPVGCKSCSFETCWECGIGYYLEGSTCAECSLFCEGCTGQGANQCTSCKKLQVFSGNSCSCPRYFYMDSHGECGECISNCVECTGSVGCEACETGYYYDTLSEVCEACDRSCSECVGYMDNCISCKNPNIVMVGEYGACDCASNQYITSENPLTCAECPEFCETCNSTKCIKCKVGFILVSSGCVQNVLNLDISLSQGGLLFSFSEDLAKSLESTDFITACDSVLADHTLAVINSSQFNISLLCNLTATTQISINITSEIVGKSNSVLQQKFYQISILSSTGSPITFYSVATILNTLALSIAMATSLSSIFTNTQPSMVWATFNTVQILSYLPLQNIQFPPDLENFLILIQSINILPNLCLFMNLYNCNSPEIIVPFVIYGYTCSYFVTNIAQTVLAFVILILSLLCFWIFYKTTGGKAQEYFLKRIKDFKYNALIRFWIESFIEIVIASVISANTVIYMQFDLYSFSDSLNSVLGVIFIVR